MHGSGPEARVSGPEPRLAMALATHSGVTAGTTWTAGTTGAAGTTGTTWAAGAAGTTWTSYGCREAIPRRPVMAMTIAMATSALTMSMPTSTGDGVRPATSPWCSSSVIA